MPALLLRGTPFPTSASTEAEAFGRTRFTTSRMRHFRAEAPRSPTLLGRVLLNPMPQL